MITRDPREAARRAYDPIIIGGGIYGACLALEAARRGLRPVLLERDDFGGATSWNTGRIIHGGIRYLQRLDLRAARAMARERSWFLRHFPDLVRPVPFVLPLYGRGLKRPFVLRAGLALNDRLSRPHNRKLRRDRRLPRGRMLGPRQALGMFPQLRREGLLGAGTWYDAMLESPQRLLIEVLHWACALGAVALNYLEVEELLVESGRVTGVRACDSLNRETLVFRGAAVVNCAGPWAGGLAKKFDRDVAGLGHAVFLTKALLDRPPLAEAALGVEPERPGSHVYFLCPCRGRLLVGGHHSAWSGEARAPAPSEAILRAMIDDLNLALPALELRREEVLRTYTGLIPASRGGGTRFAGKEIVHEHGRNGGPERLVSVWGIKYSRARLVAEQVLRKLYAGRWQEHGCRPGSERRPTQPPLDLHDPGPLLRADDATAGTALSRVAEQEAVARLDDLLLRRTDWLCDPRMEQHVTDRARSLLEWKAAAPSRPGAQTSGADSSQ